VAFSLGVVFASAVGLVAYGSQSFLASVGIREGVYALQGNSVGASSATSQYYGNVSVRRVGSVYFLDWQIGSQTQVGVGLLRNGVLSVSYADTTGGQLNDSGVVAYKVTGTGLEGEWTSFSSTGAVGHERLVWQQSTLAY
jgi:hypothetical protein